MLKKCNICNSEQDEFLNVGGRNYCKSCNSEININSSQILVQKQKSLHKMKVALDTFYNVLEPLEEYIEKAGYYSDFKRKRQRYRKTIFDSEGSLGNDEDLFLSNLYVFTQLTVKGKPEFFREVIKEDFYRWINHSGITADNCSEVLKHFLIEINNVLEDRGEKIIGETDARDRDVEIDPREMIGIFRDLQNPLNRNRDQRTALEDRYWNEIDDNDRLKGDSGSGKRAFQEIERSVSVPHQNFRLRYFGKERPMEQKNYNPQVSSSQQGDDMEIDDKDQDLRLEKPLVKDVDCPQKNNNKIGTGGIVATVAGISALAVGGVVAIKKKLNKKNKG